MLWQSLGNASPFLLVRQGLELDRALHPLTVEAAELRHLLLLLVLQGPLCHRHLVALVALPLHLLQVLLVPLRALPWPQVLPKEQSLTE